MRTVGRFSLRSTSRARQDPTRPSTTLTQLRAPRCAVPIVCNQVQIGQRARTQSTTTSTTAAGPALTPALARSLLATAGNVLDAPAHPLFCKHLPFRCCCVLLQQVVAVEVKISRSPLLASDLPRQVPSNSQHHEHHLQPQ
ncbi:hypothetical protein AMAG_18277 [Allomyces macrogynus ATCC 38327]|uniref:Uncharacterized protein n=1 Tax=Allomyces macrogynus (strain ATCC 38327) TaxID=578462 RepID=A0A0L0S860_ALLM3|nr:hypothetical protein AMAG_18277 [Allomyces macrogynus ATCC 38327]|eukprot:KNE58600.1 hypothetical protein AMAG_18277 [Allomyces macrogynus ATCC 38327]